MKKILHLDDEPEIRELLAAYLESIGYEVQSVASAADAFRAIESSRPDLVICDLQLDEGDGLQVVDRLKTILPNVPVILLTGVLLAPGVAEEAFTRRGIVYVEKTKPLQVIVGEIRRLLGT